MKKIIVLGFCLASFGCCAAEPKYKISDHFNGEKFFNPTLTEQFSPSFSDIIEMVKYGRAEWPESVKTIGVPKLYETLEENDIAVTFVNHATFLLQFQGKNILTDPVWATRASPVSWFGPKRVREAGVKLADLPKIDIVLISHNHYDHLDIDTLKELNERFSPKVIVPLGDKALIESIGVKNVQELDWWDQIETDNGMQITFTPAQHSSSRGLFDRDRSLWGSYYIKHGNRSVYFGGDSGYATHFSEIKKRLGSPDIALLSIGSYAPRFFMKPIHMNPAEAVLAHKDLDSKLSIGMHFGTYQLASEPFNQPQIDLDVALEKAHIPKRSFVTLQEGETRLDLR